MPITILLVDDHQILRDGLRALLECESGVRVVGDAWDGRIAIERARELKPDIIVMDIQMKGLNGIEATRQIVADTPAAKVIALSTYAYKQYVIEMFKAGAMGYLLKDSAAAELVRAIRAVQKGERFLGEGISGVVIECLREGSQKDVSAFTVLSPREREVLQLVAEGKSTRDIAEQIHRAESTVETIRANVSRKLNLHSVADLTRYAIREGLTTPER